MKARPKGEGRRANAAPEIHDNQQRNQQQYCANDGDASKALPTMQARAALSGCTLHELSGGLYSIRAVGDLLRQIGGRR